MNNTDKILKELKNHSKIFAAHDEKLNAIENKLIDHDKQFDRLINAVLKNTEDITEIKQNMVKKDEFNNLVSSVDAMAIKVKKLVEDHVFVIDWLKRLQMQVDNKPHFSAVS